MNKNFVTTHNLLSFPRFTNVGITNFATYSNSTWGNMSIKKNPDAVNTLPKIFETVGISSKSAFYIGADHNNNVQTITQKNRFVYEEYNTLDLKSPIPLTMVVCDAIITKEQFPILVTPADCAIVGISGIDENDGKRFLIVIHAGLVGAYLDVLKRSLTIAHADYSFTHKDLNAVVSPYIHGEHYKKNADDKRMQKLLADDIWKKYIISNDAMYEIHFGKKLEDDLQELDIPFESTNLDTYTEHKQNQTLYSYTYEKEIDDDYGNFLVGMGM